MDVSLLENLVNNMELTTKTLSDLAKIMSDQKLTSLEIDQGNLKIKLKRDIQLKEAHFPERLHLQEVPVHPLTPFMPEDEKKPAVSVIDPSLIEIKSPMVGVFYQSSKPDGEAFISIGQSFTEGDTLCIIEAMKLMNEITAESSGIIMEVCVENGQVVEYGQVLYRIQERR